jgi:hypothetical protein
MSPNRCCQPTKNGYSGTTRFSRDSGAPREQLIKGPLNWLLKSSDGLDEQGKSERIGLKNRY